MSANGSNSTNNMNKPVYNGMPARELGNEGWRKPWSGGNGGSCVEALKLNDGRVALRQSTDPDGPALIYTHLHPGRQGWRSRLPAVLTSDVLTSDVLTTDTE
jgi:hypothetical protein